MNSNTFSDAPDQPRSYKFGSLSHTDAAVRAQAVEHNLECIEIGEAIGSKALTVWIGDGSNFPGQTHFTRAFERYLGAMREIYAAPARRLAALHRAQDVRARVLLDGGAGLGHQLPDRAGARAEGLLPRRPRPPRPERQHRDDRRAPHPLRQARRLPLQRSKYGDDDLDAGSIDPYRLFLVFNELVDAEERRAADFAPAHMLDQSHNVTDPIESLMVSAMEVQRAYAQALLVDRTLLEGYQDSNDALMATTTLKQAFRTDVEPILAQARLDKGAAIDPVAAFRASGYRAKVAEERPKVASLGGGIV